MSVRKLMAVVGLICVVCVSAQAAQRPALEFATKPTVAKEGKQYKIEFALKDYCDVTVAVVGKDGRIVRHLASGLLGANAPPPFTKGTLKQSLVWDGKDDKGGPAPPGYKVRVSLGVTPLFDRLVEWDPVSIFRRGVVGLAVAQDGTLWVLQGKAWERTVGNPEVVAFTRDGKYLKTIVPFRADLSPEELPQVKFRQGPDGLIPLGYRDPGGREYDSFLPGLQGLKRQTIILTGDGLIVASGSSAPVSGGRGGRGRRLLKIGLDGSTDDGYEGPKLPETSFWGERFFLAASPEGKTIYLAGLWDYKVRGHSQCVFRARWSDDVFAPFVGEVGVAGKDEKHFNDPRGLAFDTRGRLLVCDYGNDRIQVFSSEGNFVRSLNVVGPEQVVVHPQTGELYVLSVRDRGNMASGYGVKWETIANKSLIKYKSADDFTEIARIDLPKRELYLHDPGPIVALDSSTEPPLLWVSCVGRAEPGDYLWKIEDRGDSLVQLETPMGKYYCPFGIGAGALAVDAQTGDAYFGGRTTPTLFRIDGKTGKLTRLDKVADYIYDGDTNPFKPRQVTTMAVDGQGRLYIRLMGTWSGMENWILRVNRDGTPAPFTKAGKAITITQPSHGYHSGGMGIAANGDIYVVDLVPGGKHRDPSEHNVLNIYAPDGSLKQAQAMKWLTSGAWGPRFDSKGNMYFTESVRPTGEDVSERIGSLVRFSSASPELVFGEALAQPQADYEMRRYERDIVPVSLSGADWIYFGVSPVPFGHCVCPSAPFDLDGFDRIVVTDATNLRVKLLDSAGNLIAALGRYGNRDSRGPQSSLPVPPIPIGNPASVANADNLIYVFDQFNNRIVRIRLNYRVEELVPVP